MSSTGGSCFSALKLAIRLYIRRRDYDCVVLGAWKSDFCFAAMQAILPLRKVPCILIDCIWYKSNNRIKQKLKTLFMKIIDSGVNLYIVWARQEVESYSKAFGLRKEKFVFIPYHTTLDNYELVPCEGDYIFSGGNFGRDYRTFLEAASGLQIRVEVACTRPELFKGLPIPQNVRIQGYTELDYLQKMAGCRINVVSLDAGLLHCGGQQTFLNSMFLGKPTIVNDPEGAGDYINNGVDGLLVPPRDPNALKEAMLLLLKNTERAREMGRRAKEKVRGYSTEEHFKKIVDVACGLVQLERWT